MLSTRIFGVDLSKSDQTIIESILQAEVFIQTAEYDGASPTALNTLVKKHGVQLHRYPDSLLIELGKRSSEVVNEVGNKDSTTKAVWDSYRKFRKTAIKWSQVGVQGFMQARALPFTYG